MNELCAFVILSADAMLFVGLALLARRAFRKSRQRTQQRRIRAWQAHRTIVVCNDLVLAFNSDLQEAARGKDWN